MNNLYTYRVKASLTQQELANKISKSRGFIARLEGGHVLPNISIVRLLAKILECTVNDIFPE